jgi:predicted PurR-regulated permease PerM
MRTVFFLLATIILAVFILMKGKFVFAPLVLAAFLAILISPMVKFLEGNKVWKSVSVVITVALFFSVLAGLFISMVMQYNGMIEEMPSFTTKLDQYVSQIREVLSTQLGVSKSFISNSAEQLKEGSQSQAGDLFGALFMSLSSFLSFIILLPVFTFLMLYYRDSFRAFVKNLSQQYSEVTFVRWIKTISEIQGVVRSYLTGLLYITLILATLNTIGLLVLGVPYAFILGISAAVLSIIPYLGNLLGGGLAALLALATSGEWTALGVVILFGVIQALEGNLITPKVMGNQVGVNPLVVILALLIGGYIWGIIGMIVSVPAVAILKVLLDEKEELKPFANLIEGNE